MNAFLFLLVGVVRFEGALHVHGGAHGAHGVLEIGHQGVADGLADGSAVLFGDGAEHVNARVNVNKTGDVAEFLEEAGGAYNVRKHHRDFPRKLTQLFVKLLALLDQVL